MNTFRDSDGSLFAINPLKIVCDFCSGTPVEFAYPAQDFSRNYTLGDANVQANSHGAWAACAECHKLVQASDRDALAERSVASFPIPASKIPPEIRAQLKTEIRAMQDTFWAAREGAPAPVRV